MKVLLSLSYGSNEAKKIVDLPEGLSPFIGMKVHTENDVNLQVKDVDFSIDKANTPEDPAVILIVEETSIGNLDDQHDGEVLFHALCDDLEACGWTVPKL